MADASSKTGRFLQDVFPAEIEEIRARRRRLDIPDDALTDSPRSANGLFGLSFCGGGIRSATFGLGIVQALDACGLLKAADYISTVSGGGFIGGCVSSMLASAPPASSPWTSRPGVPEGAAARHLRNSSRYLASGGVLDTLRIGAVVVRGILINAVAFAPYVMLATLVTDLIFDYNLARIGDPEAWNLAYAVLFAVVSVFVALIVTFPMISTVIGRWLTLAWRGRYEKLQSAGLLAVLLAVALVPMFYLATMASFLTGADVADQWRDVLATVSQAPVWQFAIGVVALGVVVTFVVGLVRMSASGLSVAMHAIGLMAPAALVIAYLLACVLQIETPQLATLAWDAEPDVTTIRALDAGLVSERLARVVPHIGADDDRRPPQPQLEVESAEPGERLIAVDGAIHAIGEDEKGQPAERAFALAVDWPLNNEMEDLDAGRLPPRLAGELVQHRDVWRRLGEASVRVSKPHAEWRLVGPDEFTFVVRLAPRSLRIYWERPFEDRRRAPPHLDEQAHVTTLEPGRVWQLTTAGRSLVVRLEHQRLRLFWDLTPSLDQEILSDVLFSSFGEVKGPLPIPLRIQPSYTTGATRVNGWALCGGDRSAICNPHDRATFFIAPLSAGRFWSTKRASLAVSSPLGYGVLALVLLALNTVFINVNRNSAHGFYRDRISEAFVIKPDPRGSGAVVNNDSQKLSTLGGPESIAPYHLINCTLNLGGMTAPATIGRACDFFLFSKRYVGSERTTYWNTAELERRDPHLDLATAMAISGAAAAPNMGTSTAKPVRFMLALLNVRLDYWLPNPAMMAGSWLKRLRLHGSIGPRYLWREALGRIDASGPFLNLSDGFHIENLGIYELLRRRCRLIVALDSGADPDLTFDDLLLLIMRARIDMGIEIQIDLATIRRNGAGFSGSHVAVGRVRYADGDGWLVYVKASLTDDEDELIHDYWRRVPPFPHQSTANQFFDERQFEMYRALGEHVGETLAGAIAGTRDLSEVFADDKAAALTELRRALAVSGAPRPTETPRAAGGRSTPPSDAG